MVCATALVSIALLGAGCKKGDPIVGKWTGAMAGKALPPGVSATYEFKPDKAMAVVAQQGPITMTMTGVYALEGENLTITFKDVQTTGVPQEQAGLVDSLLAPIKKQLTAKPIQAKMKVVSDDEISLSAEGGKESTTLTRIKENS